MSPPSKELYFSKYKTMKRIFVATMCLLAVACGAFAQVKKSKLIIVPSTRWCVANDYVTTYTDMSGEVQKAPNYDKAFLQDADVSKMIGAMQNFMINEGYQVEDLKLALENIKKDNARDNAREGAAVVNKSQLDILNETAQPDIVVELDFEFKRQGPYKFIEFQADAKDAYLGTPVSAGNIGRGTATSATDVVNQLEEAVLSFKDKFINDMETYYGRMLKNGRQIKLVCKVGQNTDLDFESEFGDEELNTLIENWVTDNAVNGNASSPRATKTTITFDDVRIPLTYTDGKGREKGADAKWFARNLAKYIKDTTGASVAVDSEGLGKVNVILGGK